MQVPGLAVIRLNDGMDSDAANELRELREQNARIKRLLAESQLERMPCERSPMENSEPSCQAPRRGHAQGHVEHVGAVGVQGRWGRPALPTAGSRWRRPLLVRTPK